MSLEVVKLKNGAEEAKVLVAGHWLAFKTLQEQHSIAMYELVELCRDPDHELFANAGEVLQGFAMVKMNGSKGVVHDSTRNIVLSASEDYSAENPVLVHPIQEPPKDRPTGPNAGIVCGKPIAGSYCVKVPFHETPDCLALATVLEARGNDA